MYVFTNDPLPPRGIRPRASRLDDVFRGIRSGQCIRVQLDEIGVTRQRALHWLKRAYPKTGKVVTRSKLAPGFGGVWIFFDEMEGMS